MMETCLNSATVELFIVDFPCEYAVICVWRTCDHLTACRDFKWAWLDSQQADEGARTKKSGAVQRVLQGMDHRSARQLLPCSDGGLQENDE